MNNQEAYNKVVERLMDGKGRAVQRQAMNSSHVRYRTDTGLACAIGYLVSDDYDPSMENKSITALIETRHPAVASLNGLVSLGLLADLQTIHDRADLWVGGKLTPQGIERLYRTGIKHHLKVPAKVKEAYHACKV